VHDMEPGRDELTPDGDHRLQQASSRQISKFNRAYKLMTNTKFVIVISWVG
jgi:hypothetical protein